MCTESLTWKVMYRNRYNIVAIEWKTIDSRIDEYLYRFENVRAQLANGARVKWECSASEARVVRDSVRTPSWELEIRDKVRQFTTIFAHGNVESSPSQKSTNHNSDPNKKCTWSGCIYISIAHSSIWHFYGSFWLVCPFSLSTRNVRSFTAAWRWKITVCVFNVEVHHWLP